MNVTFLVNNYPPSVGGVQEHVRQVAEGLVRRHGMNVEVLTTDALLPPGGPAPGHVPCREETICGVIVHRRPVARRVHSALRALRRAGRRFGVYRPGRNTLLITGPLGVRLAVAAARLARRSDVVVGVGAPSAALWAAGAFTRWNGAAVVAMPLIHIHDDRTRPWVLRTVRRADGVSANSAVERAWLVARGVAQDRIEVLPPGCDSAAYPQMEPHEARAVLGLDDLPTVGFVGRMAAHKGVDTLLVAMRSIWDEHPDTQLLLAGPDAGWDVSVWLDELSAEQRQRVIRWGAYSNEERALLLASCEVVAQPSRSESFGMVTVEAWCAGRAVVVGDIDVTRALVRDGVDGELVPVNSPESLAASLRSLLADAELRYRYGAAGRRRARAEFDWSRIVDGWAAMIGSLVPLRSQGHVRA